MLLSADRKTVPVIPLFLREIRVRLHLVDLFGVTLAVRGDEDHPFVAIELFAERTVHGVLAQIFRFFQKGNRLGAAGLEVF